MEREQEARMEELKNDPMKQLEERTVASNNEMKRADGLEELQEISRIGSQQRGPVSWVMNSHVTIIDCGVL